jgi:hypothetical protein
MKTTDLIDYLNEYLTPILPQTDQAIEWKQDLFIFLLCNKSLEEKTRDAIRIMEDNDFGGPSDIIHDLVGIKSGDEFFVPKIIKLDQTND